MEKLGLEAFLCLFDLDGTLVASENKIYQAVVETRSLLGYSQSTFEYIAPQIGLPARLLFFDLDLSENELESVVRIFRNQLSQIQFAPSDVYPGITEILEILRNSNVQSMVATNKPKKLAELALSGTKLDSYFAYVVGGDNLAPKPDSAILNACISKSEKNQYVMIGDRVEDMKAASAAGAVPIGLAQGVHSRLELTLAGAHRVFSNAIEMLEALENGWNFDNL